MNIFRLGWHFIAALVRIQWFKLNGYEVIADPMRQGVRFLYCQHCDEYRDGVCTACGCPAHSKISLNCEQCPRKYWPREYVKKDSDSTA